MSVAPEDASWHVARKLELCGADIVKAIEADTALGRFGEPSEIANVVAFLASDEGRWVTGQVIEASGGYRL